MIFSRLAILGVGLMGGSLALAAKRAGVVGEVVGWSRRESTLQAALDCGAIDRAESELSAALLGADAVVVATPTQIAAPLMVDIVQQLPDSVAVTDVASVKGNIAAALRAHFGALPGNVVLGHPIAGSEQSGVAAARDDLYRDHRVILIDDKETERLALRRVEALWSAVGAEVSTMTAANHDRVLALTSHLPHLLAYALVEQLAEADAQDEVFKFAAGGFRDFSRIASSDPRMWREILLANKDEVASVLDGFEQHLARFRQLLSSGDGDALEEKCAAAKRARDNFVQ